MCGIAGFSLSPNEQVNAKRLARSLLLSIESRGYDATGFAYLDSTGAFQVHKNDTPASVFVKNRLCLPRKASTAIMHTRFATQGNPWWNENNHPLATGTVVGVHNGHINNDDELFRDIEQLYGLKDIREAQVDSEAAFAALGWTTEPVTSVLESLRGTAALAWLDKDSPVSAETLHLARVSSSPLIVGETAGGSVIFASTPEAVMDGANAVGLTITKLRDIAEGTYLQVLHGDIATVNTFEPPASSWAKSAYYRRGMSGGMAFEMDDYDWEWNTKSTTTAPGRKLVVVRNNLDARLAAEEPDFGAGDDDDSRYEQWLRENNAAVDAAMEREDTRFEEFYAQRWLHAGYLTDTQLAVPDCDSDALYLADDKHVKREAAIEQWAAGITCKDEATRTQACVALKGDVRPGTAVTTELNGCRVDGHIVSVPATFPDGWYAIRAFVFNEKRPDNYEAVYLMRKQFEFHAASAPKLAPVTMALAVPE